MKSTASLIERVRTTALRLPQTEEGIACAGTAAERRTLRVGGKAFVFLGSGDIMLKLQDSIGEATAFAEQHSDACRVGAHGWVTLTITNAAPATDTLLSWVNESYRLLAPKRLLAQLESPAPAKAAAKVKRKK
jgi:hypothetical protein